VKFELIFGEFLPSQHLWEPCSVAYKSM